MPNELSKSKRKKLDGINKNADEITCYLIGQLSKNDTYKDEIEGKEIIDYALEVIYKCHKYLGMRVILVECENKDKLINFYENNGFERISIDEKTGLIQLVRSIDNVVFHDGQGLHIK